MTLVYWRGVGYIISYFYSLNIHTYTQYDKLLLGYLVQGLSLNVFYTMSVRIYWWRMMHCTSMRNRPLSNVFQGGWLLLVLVLCLFLVAGGLSSLALGVGGNAGRGREGGVGVGIVWSSFCGGEVISSYHLEGILVYPTNTPPPPVTDLQCIPPPPHKKGTDLRYNLEYLQTRSPERGRDLAYMLLRGPSRPLKKFFHPSFWKYHLASTAMQAVTILHLGDIDFWSLIVVSFGMPGGGGGWWWGGGYGSEGHASWYIP